MKAGRTKGRREKEGREGRRWSKEDEDVEERIGVWEKKLRTKRINDKSIR